MTTINFPHEFKDIVKLYNERKFDEALRLLKNIPNDKKFENFKFKLYASIYFINRNWNKSLKYHKELLLKNEDSYEIYNNLAVTLFNIGEINESIKYFKQCITKNDNAVSAYQNLGTSYLNIGLYQEAIDCLTKVLSIDDKNMYSINMLIDLLSYVVPKKNENNYLLKINTTVLNFYNEKNLKNFEVKALLGQIDDFLIRENKFIIYNKTEIFRRNKENLNCSRHFKVFNQHKIIPEYCFNCYKVQIIIPNVSELIKLFFLFNSNFLINNNVRKCNVESRPNVTENYKGFIYCRSLEESKIVLEITNKKLIELGIKFRGIQIKHGCTEYYKVHPDYEKINMVGEQPMKYNISWKKVENKVDNTIPKGRNGDEKVIKPSINKINLSDILIIRNWLGYAEIIGDYSYKEIYKTKNNNSFLVKKLENQLDFRKQQLK